MKPTLLVLPITLALLGAGCNQTQNLVPPEPLKPAVTTQTDTVLAMHKFTDDSFGFSFTYPAEWKLEDSDGLKLSHLGPDANDPLSSDVITVRRMEGYEVHVDDAKFGPTRIFFEDVHQQWMIEQGEKGTGELRTKPAIPAYMTLSGLPVFESTGRWKTMIVPLSHKRFLVVNITGDGWTAGLDPFVKTIRTPNNQLKAEDLSKAVQQMLDSEKPTN